MKKNQFFHSEVCNLQPRNEIFLLDIMCLRIKGQKGWMNARLTSEQHTRKKSLKIFFFGVLCAYDNFVMELVPQKTITFIR